MILERDHTAVLSLHWKMSVSLHRFRKGIEASHLADAVLAHPGMVECLQQETTPFGIQSVIFEPGYYQTKIFSTENVKTPSRIDDYEEIAKGIAGFVAATNGNQPGDPIKLVERIMIIDVVNLEGMATDKSIPQRLPIGRDALATVKTKCEDTLKLCEEWEGLIVSMDIDGGE